MTSERSILTNPRLVRIRAVTCIHQNGTTPLIAACKQRTCTPTMFNELVSRGASIRTRERVRRRPHRSPVHLTPLTRVCHSFIRYDHDQHEPETAASLICRQGTAPLLQALIAHCTTGNGTMVDLSNCEIRSLNALAVALLTPIRVLDLSNNRLQSLPPELSDLSLLEHVILDGNPLMYIPKPFRKSWLKIRTFLKGIGQKASRWNERKMVLVGEEAAGKSTLLQCLRSKKHRVSCKTNLSTNGIAMHTNMPLGGFESDQPDETIMLNVMDLGGQEVFYPTHQVRLRVSQYSRSNNH